MQIICFLRKKQNNSFHVKRDTCISKNLVFYCFTHEQNQRFTTSEVISVMRTRSRTKTRAGKIESQVRHKTLKQASYLPNMGLLKQNLNLPKEWYILDWEKVLVRSTMFITEYKSVCEIYKPSPQGLVLSGLPFTISVPPTGMGWCPFSFLLCAKCDPHPTTKTWPETVWKMYIYESSLHSHHHIIYKEERIGKNALD